MKPECPLCGSKRTFYRKKAATWECKSCEARFDVSRARAQRLGDKAERPKTIFFSYGHDDNRELIQLFKGDLEKRGHMVWIDYKEIGAWEDWRGQITEGIHQSEMAIAFLSAHSTRDPGVCRSEIAMALHRFGTVYPILLEPLSRVSVPVLISHLQWPDLSDWKRIRAGKVRGQDWRRWYEAKVIEIVSRIEGERTYFAEEVAQLRAALRPVGFESKFAQHVDKFIGRDWVFKEFDDWLSGRNRSRLFWLLAGPGFGKTAVMANLAHNRRAVVVASWFCDAGSSALRDARQALRSISFQLALRWDDYRARLYDQLGLRPGSAKQSGRDLDRLNAKELFHSLLAEPLTGLIWREHKLVILIDALDEATDERGGNDLAELLSEQLVALPPWVCLAISSRPEAVVLNRMAGFAPFRLESSDARNVDDLQEFATKRLAVTSVLASTPVAQRRRLLNHAVQQSQGMILYLKMVEEGLTEGSLSLEALDKMQAGVPGLYRRYFGAFQHRFANNYDQHIKPLLRLILAAPGPLPVDLAREALKVDRESFVAARNALGAFLLDLDGGLQLFHHTLREWLLDPQSGAFHIDADLGRSALVNALWDRFERADEDAAKAKLALDWLPTMLPGSAFWSEASALRRFGLFMAAHGRSHGLPPLLARYFALKRDTEPEAGLNDIEALGAMIVSCQREADQGRVSETAVAAESLAGAAGSIALAEACIRGYASRRKGELRDAKEALARVDEALLGEAFPELSLRIRFQRAHVDHLLGDYAAAEIAYQDLAAASATGAEEIDARETARRQLADLLMLRGRFREAARGFDESAAYASRDILWAFECQRFQGHVRRFNWRLDEAEGYYATVASACEQRGLIGMQGKALVNLAETLCWSDPVRSRDLALRAIDINRQTGNAIEEGKALTALSIAQLRAGHGVKALEAATAAETLQERIGYRSGVVFASGAKALAFRRMRRKRAMRAALTQMDAITRQTGVYRFLVFAYFSACGERSPEPASTFDWLDGTDVGSGVRLMAGN